MIQFCQNDINNIKASNYNLLQLKRFNNLQGLIQEQNAQRIIQYDSFLEIRVNTEIKKVINYKMWRKNEVFYNKGLQNAIKIGLKAEAEKYEQGRQKKVQNPNQHIKKDKMNRFEETLQFYDSAIQQNSEDSEYYFSKGRIQNTFYAGNNLLKYIQFLIIYQRNMFEEALEYYDLAIQKNNENSDYYNNKAMTLFQQSRVYNYT